IIQPDSVGRGKVVTNVEVGETVPVQVSKHCGKSPVARWLNQFQTVLVTKIPTCPRYGLEPAAAQVAVEHIRFSEFDEHCIASVRGFGREALAEVDGHLEATAASGYVYTLGFASRGGSSIVGQVEVKITGAIDIRQRQ